MVVGPNRAPSAALEMLTSERGHGVFFAYKNISIAVWSGQANLAPAKAAERAAGIIAARHRAGRSYVAFMLDGLPGPTPDATEIVHAQESSPTLIPPPGTGTAPSRGAERLHSTASE